MQRPFQSNNNIRQQVQQNPLPQPRFSTRRVIPFPKRVTVFDVIAFAIVAFAIFFTSLATRSVIFNIVISCSLLIKVLIGAFFYRKNNTRALRLYFFYRYLYNIVVVYPLIILFKYVSATYTINFFLAGGLVLILEVIITAIYCKYMCGKTPLENIEDIPGFKVHKRNKEQIIMHLQTQDSATYVIKSLGKKTSEKIVKNQNQKYQLVKKQNFEKSTTKKGMTNQQEIKLYQNIYENYGRNFKIARTEEEIQAEIQYEEILKAKKNNVKRYTALEPSMSRNPINEIQFFENKSAQRMQEIQDARTDYMKELEKFQRAKNKMNSQETGPEETEIKKDQLKANEVIIEVNENDISLSDIQDEKLNDTNPDYQSDAEQEAKKSINVINNQKMGAKSMQPTSSYIPQKQLQTNNTLPTVPAQKEKIEEKPKEQIKVVEQPKSQPFREIQSQVQEPKSQNQSQNQPSINNTQQQRNLQVNQQDQVRQQAPKAISNVPLTQQPKYQQNLKPTNQRTTFQQREALRQQLKKQQRKNSSDSDKDSEDYNSENDEESQVKHPRQIRNQQQHNESSSSLSDD